MKRIVAILVLLVAYNCGIAQSAEALHIEDCYTMAKENYPLIKQRDLIQKTKDFTIENAAKGWLPQVALVASGTYQSDVVAFNMAGAPALRKDNYKFGAEVNQPIYDGGDIKNKKEMQKVNADIQEQALEVNLYTVAGRVNQLYFGILLIDEQLKQNELRRSDIQSGLDKTKVAFDNGTAFQSSIDELKAELVNADQSKTELESNRMAFVNMLSLLINKPLEEKVVLVKPDPLPVYSDINRPELKLYDAQKKSFDIQEKRLKVNYLPKLSAFAQGYYGAPTYNIVDNNFGLFGLLGMRFNWPLSGLYTNKNDKSLLDINRRNTDIEKETFLFNTNITMSQEKTDLIKYDKLIRQDNEIIQLREAVKTAAKSQLTNGVITPHDYIIKVNAEDQARQNLILHQIQQLQVQYNNKNTTGN